MTDPIGTAQERELPRYLLVKRGLYYRPDSQGYTGCKDRAGRYHASDASPEHGITAVHEDDAPLFSDGCSPEVVREIAASRIAEVGRLEAALPIFERVTRLAHNLSCDVPITAAARKHIQDAYDALAVLSLQKRV